MTTDGILSTARLGQVAINAKDLERAKTFYQDVLGFPLLFEAGAMCFFQCGDVRLMLGKAEKPEFDHPSSILYFKVNGIEEHHQRLKAAGVSFIQDPHLVAPMPDHDLWMAFFRDSEDNVLALMGEEPKAGC